MDAEKTGKLIKELRTEKGLTQQELAARLKVSSTAVSKWENGKNLPDISMLEPLAETLGVSIYDIVKGKSPAQKEETEMAAETASEKGSADAAIKSVIDAAIDQRKKRTRRIIRTVLALSLITLVFWYYYHDESVPQYYTNFAELRIHHETDYLLQQGMITEFADIEIRKEDIRRSIEEALGTNALDIEVETLGLIWRSDDIRLQLYLDDEKMSVDNGPESPSWPMRQAEYLEAQWSLRRRIEETQKGLYQIGTQGRLLYAGPAGTDVTLNAHVWIKVTYRDRFILSRRHEVLLISANYATDTISVR